jgi:hypothetical protein
MKHVRGNLIALLAVAALALAGQREATAARCKADGETCRRSRSCCGTSGHNGVCVKASGAKFGVCCTPDCTGKECGDDGCGGSCGTCTPPATCTANICALPTQCCGSPIGAFVGECVVETTCDANHPQNFGPGSCSPNPCPTCPCFGGFALCSFACTNDQEVNSCVSVLGPCDQFCLEGCRFACSSAGADCATASCGPLCP